MSFDRLAEPVRRWIWHKGWNSLHDIQERAIPALLNGGKDVIISAATAGGKTEAAFLPLISLVLERPGEGGFDLVYVGPLRALINDQFERLEDLCDRAELPVYPWHGDISQGVKTRARKNPRGVLLITPESLEALFVLRGLEIPTLFKSARADRHRRAARVAGHRARCPLAVAPDAAGAGGRPPDSAGRAVRNAGRNDVGKRVPSA